MRFIPNRSVIMEQAHVWLREHEARVANGGGKWFGKPLTLSYYVKRAWQAARQEIYFAYLGYNTDMLFYSIAVPDDEQESAQ